MDHWNDSMSARQVSVPYVYTLYLLFLILMLWHREVTSIRKESLPLVRPGFESGRRLNRHRIASRQNGRSQTDCAIDDQVKKNLNAIARPYDDRSFSPLDTTYIYICQNCWYMYLYMYMYIYNVYTVLLTHCVLVTPHGDIYLCQHWLRLWLVAPSL